MLVNPLSLGGRTVNATTQAEWAVVVALMIVIVFIGIMVDIAFTRVDRSVRRRYGLMTPPPAERRNRRAPSAGRSDRRRDTRSARIGTCTSPPRSTTRCGPCARWPTPTESRSPPRRWPQSQGLPSKFLESILNDMRRAGILLSQRGAEGGYRLSRPASEIIGGRRDPAARRAARRGARAPTRGGHLRRRRPSTSRRCGWRCGPVCVPSSSGDHRRHRLGRPPPIGREVDRPTPKPGSPTSETSVSAGRPVPGSLTPREHSRSHHHRDQ